MTKPTNDQIEDAIADAEEAMDGDSKWPDLTYEQGVAEALRWALGQTNLHPLSD